MKRTIVGISLVALVLMVAAASAFALDDTVNVTAQANSKLNLTLSTHAVPFGAVDPGTAVGGGVDDVVVSVQSNKAYTVSSLVNDPAGATQMGLSNTFVGGPQAKGVGTWNDDYSITVPWDTTPDVPLTASVMYTAIQ